MGMTAQVDGNITTDPDLRYTPNAGTAVVELSVADNRRWTDSSGVVHDDPSFITVVFWKELAEHVAETLHKGDRIVAEGRLEEARWETEAGEKRSKHRIIANSVGVSLRFATATVHRTPRPDAGPTDLVDASDPALEAKVSEAKARRGAKVPATVTADDGSPF
jgi:single-strand DNA-binding protein